MSIIFSQQVHVQKGRVSLQLIDLMEGFFDIMIALSMLVKTLETLKSLLLFLLLLNIIPTCVRKIFP